MPEHVDVLIIGAGLSGIGAARHLQDAHPRRSFAILEMRDASGGTWDLFRYPGIRSDSDMHTLGYRFKPWTAAKAIADGPAILDYVRETAAEAGIDAHIRYGKRVVGASWSSDDARWTVATQDGDEFTCGFLYSCTGYYDYENPYRPEFAGEADFAGEIVHPQHWRDDIDYAGKRVVIIGSGATAVTMVPAMTDEAAHVTMLQRSPTYVISLPGEDPIAKLLRRVLPDRVAYTVIRWKNVLGQAAFFQLARRRPRIAKRLLRKGLEALLPDGYDIDRHFTPTYDPWDQRVCLVPDADLFRALRKGTASVVTDRIERFTETGIRLESGEELEADLIVTATGLNLLPIGGLTLTVDGREIALPEVFAYKAMMLEGVPNFALAIGYTNASWTLKCDLTCEYVCRLLAHMDAGGYDTCTPVNDDPSLGQEPLLTFTSGYVQRAIHLFPKQGARSPWRVRQNYAYDVVALRYGALEDGAMVFSSKRPAAAPRTPVAAPSP